MWFQFFPIHPTGCKVTVTLVIARNPPNLVAELLGFIPINCDHFGTYSTISRECYIFVTLWRHTCYTCYSDLKLGTGVGGTHIHHVNIISSLFVRYKLIKQKKPCSHGGSNLFTFCSHWFQFGSNFGETSTLWRQEMKPQKWKGLLTSQKSHNGEILVTIVLKMVQHQ